MKRAILTTILLIVVCFAYADPGDVVISFFIPNAKVAKFQTAYLRARPIRGNYTAKQWVTLNAKKSTYNIYKRGVILLAQDAAMPDPNILGE